MALVDVLAEAVTVRAPNGEIVYANRAALDHLGFATVEELRARPTTAIFDQYVVEDEHGRPLTHGDVPSIRLMRGEEVAPLLLRTVNRETGELRWNLLKAAALRDERGEFVAAMTVIEDVTAVKTAETRTRALAESGRILASSLDYQQTLRNIAEVAVPALADFCVVDLLDEHSLLERVAIAVRDPARRDLAERLGSLGPVDLAPEHPAGRVLLTGVSELYHELGPDELAEAAPARAHRRVLTELGLRSMVIVPLRVPARTTGLLTLATDHSNRALGDDDVDLAEQLGRRVAVAVENSRLHTTLAGVAETLQQALLPAGLPEVPGWEVAALYEPIESELRIDVGGDFYEVFEYRGSWFAIVGDVTGKGVTAASLTALLRHGARIASRGDPSPAAILALLDESLSEIDAARPAMATALCLAIREDRVVLSSAGHPQAVLVGAGGEIREVPRPDPILGAFADAERHDETVTVARGELLLLYTDGVIDTPGRNQRFGPERLRAFLAAQAGAGVTPAVVLKRLRSELSEFSAGQGRDDIAALALRRR